MELLKSPVPVTKPRKRSLWKTLAYSSAAAVVIAVLAGVLLFYFLPDIMINRFVKGRIEREFAKAYPEYSIRIPSMQYNIQENRVEVDSLSLSNLDSSLSCTIAKYSVSGIGWLELLWARALVPSGFGGTVVDAEGIAVMFTKSQYELRCGLFHLSVPDSEIVVDALELHPSGSDEQFFAGSKFRRTRFRLVLPRSEVMGLACLELLQGKMYRTRSVNIRDVFIDVLINKDKPAARDTASPPMPNEILASMEQAIEMDSLDIWNGGLRYGERFVVGKKPAVITLDSMQVSVRGIDNHGDVGDTAVIRAKGEFMKSAQMNILMSIPMSSPEFSFQYSGSMSRMDLRALNPFLETAEQMRIKSGVLRGATFKVNVASGRASGNVRVVYKNLILAAINKHTGSEKGFFDGIASFVANTFKIRGTNMPDESGSLKIGAVNYVRKRDDPFFGFTWFALRSGLGDVVGF